MMHLYKWKASRAGPAITVNGVDQDDKTAKIVGIKEIKVLDAGVGYIAAIGRDGNLHRLYLSN